MGLAVVGGGSAAWADGDDRDAPECIDALISGRILQQTPTPIPDCGADCIVMSWPWIMRLDVEEVVGGEAPRGRLMVLSMQHTWFQTGHGVVWGLRRNSAGGFNLVRGVGVRPKFCSRSDPAPAPYITADRASLLEMERDGQARWGFH